MKNLRPALPIYLHLALLLSAAGLGAPAGFAQAKSAAKKNVPASHSSSAKSSSSRKASFSKASASRSSAPTSSTGHKTTGSHTGISNRAGKKSTKRSRKQPGQKAPTNDRVSEIQTALAKDGSYQGAPNGKWDDDTAVAMRKFQANHGLNPTGRLDALSLQKLGLGSQIAGVAAPTPPPGAISRLASSIIATPATQSETSRRP